MNRSKKNEHSDIFTFLIGAVIAAALIIGGILLSKVIWPMIKWAARKAWTKIRGQSNKAKDAPAEKFTVSTPELPTPDVFKGSQNLGPLREFKF